VTAAFGACVERRDTSSPAVRECVWRWLLLLLPPPRASLANCWAWGYLLLMAAAAGGIGGGGGAVREQFCKLQPCAADFRPWETGGSLEGRMGSWVLLAGGGHAGCRATITIRLALGIIPLRLGAR
jgi:hypothetical protein